MADPLRIWIVAGEESGDQLGAKLMRALKDRLGSASRFDGVGGKAMAGGGHREPLPAEATSP